MFGVDLYQLGVSAAAIFPSEHLDVDARRTFVPFLDDGATVVVFHLLLQSYHLDELANLCAPNRVYLDLAVV